MIEALQGPVIPDGAAGLDALLDRIAAERECLERQLSRSGVLLLRGWHLSEAGALGRLAREMSRAPLFDYSGGASPRTALGGGSYSSTDYPPDLRLALHNELSYSARYPTRLYFHCRIAPTRGGATTVGDSRRILAAIDPQVHDRFRAKGLLYIRTLWPVEGSGYSWQEALGTRDPDEVSAVCDAIGADHQWLDDGSLRLSQSRPATAVHPETGDEVWFNQADGFHPSALDAATYAELLALCGSEERFRLNVRYGDGAPIEPEALADIRAVIAAETVPHRWQQGDVLVIDNLLAAHGREPFAGERAIALAMT